MDKNILYQNTVKSCTKCNGTGVKDMSTIDIVFCECQEFYNFVCRWYDSGIPIKYIYNYEKIEINWDKKIYFFFQDDQNAFNTLMSLPDWCNYGIKTSNEMFNLNKINNYAGIMIYNLGLETFQNNSLVLYRLIKEIEDNRCFGIFSFAIKESNLSNFYLDFIKKKINEYK